MNQVPIVLASTSPYRRALMERTGLRFSVMAPAVDETPLAGESPERLVRRLAIAKAGAVKPKQTKSLIIGADQVAVFGKKILGKPGNHANAVRQLTMVSGKSVRFLTAVCVRASHTGKIHTRVVPCEVHFRDLQPREIEKYLKIDKPYDCAGSAKVEALGIALIKRIKGDDPNALIGLPMIALVELLSKHGLKVL